MKNITYYSGKLYRIHKIDNIGLVECWELVSIAEKIVLIFSLYLIVPSNFANECSVMPFIVLLEKMGHVGKRYGSEE